MIKSLALNIAHRMVRCGMTSLYPNQLLGDEKDDCKSLVPDHGGFR